MTSDSDLYSRWTQLSDQDISSAAIVDILEPLHDDIWVAAACADRVLDNVDVQRALLDLGLSRTISTFETIEVETTNSDCREDASQESETAQLLAYFNSYPEHMYLCCIRALLLNRLDRLNTYVELEQAASAAPAFADNAGDIWEVDAWEEPASESDKIIGLPSLSVFLSHDLVFLSRILATTMQYNALRKVTERHFPTLFPYRFSILEKIPTYSNPIDYQFLLPGVDANGLETYISPRSWREVSDWTEAAAVQDALKVCDHDMSVLSESPISQEHTYATPRTSHEISKWYISRIERILSSSKTALVDTALSLVELGASKGVSGLDEIGEDIGLMSRLAYGRPLSSIPEESISLDGWRSLQPVDVIRRYLAHSTPQTVVSDIRTLVLPYAFVLESRLERSGKPNPDLAKELLYAYVLETSLDISLSIFESSKPTMTEAQRLIANDEDLARLALARMYGDNSTHGWSIMTRIFECLPAWSAETIEGEEDEAETTIRSLSDYLQPTTAHPHRTPGDLILFFQPLPARSLSRILDFLDVHLESGEILEKWGVPVPLRWFLQSVQDIAQQRALATKMVRQGTLYDGELSTAEDWSSLQDDMFKLASGGYPQSAFGLLADGDILRVFWSGILASGNFTLAKHLLGTKSLNRKPNPETLEELCLACSREFYDNSPSGNYKFGNMKLAYDCLSVAPSSPAIDKEREFIEATSRITSFNVLSRPGVAISPIEIRLTKDKLSLVSRVLSSNDTAYKHTEIILDLVRKLGHRDNIVAEFRALAMIAETALQSEDFGEAYEVCERMVNTILQLKSSSSNVIPAPILHETTEICWVACFQLGRQPEFFNTPRKMWLLGRALEHCSPDHIADILTSWRKLEQDDMESRRHAMDGRKALTPMSSNLTDLTSRRVPSLASRLQNIHLPSPSLAHSPNAAALASQATQAFSNIAANFPFSVRDRLSHANRSRSRDTERTPVSPDVQSQARHALQKGIGWLIGADEDEL